MNKRLLAIPALTLICFFARAGEGPETSRESVRGDIDRSTRQLAELRESLDGERRPLARRADELRAEVMRLRTAIDGLHEERAGRRERLAALESRLAAARDEVSFTHDLLREYRRALETRAHAVEVERHAGALEAADRYLAKPPPEGLHAAAEELLTLAEERNRGLLGGQVFSGRVVAADGHVLRGRIALSGPQVWFIAREGAPAGLVRSGAGEHEPALVIEPDANLRQAIGRLVDGFEVRVPVDVTGGDALRAEAARPGLREQFRQGGFVMAPLALVALLSAILAVLKLAELARWRGSAEHGLDEAAARLRESPTDGAKAAAALPQPLAEIIAVAAEHCSAGREQLEELLHEQIVSRVPRFERYLGTLAVLGGVAPLLGLLGTVTGMIHTFQLVTVFGTGDARVLSSGISEALVTTQFGLMIAVPVLIGHALMARRVRVLVAELEDSAAAFVARLYRERV